MTAYCVASGPHRLCSRSEDRTSVNAKIYSKMQEMWRRRLRARRTWWLWGRAPRCRCTQCWRQRWWSAFPAGTRNGCSPLQTHLCLRKTSCIPVRSSVEKNPSEWPGEESKGRGQTILTMILLWVYTCQLLDFPGSSDGKESACKAGDQGWIPGSGRPLGEGNGNPLQYSCLENFMDRKAWQATVHESQRVGLD